MKRNMYGWLDELRDGAKKRPMPILSFPAAQLLGLSVRDLVCDADNQARAMKAVADRIPSAASVSFMDLSVEAECFGAETVFTETEVPTVCGALVASEEEAESLSVPAVGAARSGLYVAAIEKAVGLITDRPVLAGMIGSFSLAGRLVDVTEALVYCYTEPDMLKTVLEKSTDFLVEYAKAFKAAGANGVVIAEPLAGLLSPDLAAEFSEPYVKRVVDAVQDENFIVVYHNCGNTAVRIIDSVLRTGAAAYHFGNAIDMAEMLPHIPENTVAMGNIDPAGEFANGTPQSISAATTALLKKCGHYKNFVISSGCDIPPHAKWENIDAFFNAVGEFYGK
ncbi:MAG: methyltransferase [Bacillota bacterium]|nr:MAG: methyltransferase [Bacillota bacterium]